MLASNMPIRHGRTMIEPWPPTAYRTSRCITSCAPNASANTTSESTRVWAPLEIADSVFISSMPLPPIGTPIMWTAMGGETGLWDTANAEATLPAQDIERAKAFYAEQLGLSPTSEDKVGVHFVVGGTRFRLFRSGGS